MSYLITQVCMRIGGIRPGCNGISRNTDSKSRRYLRWLVLLLLNVLTVRLRRLNPRRLDFILDLESVYFRLFWPMPSLRFLDVDPAKPTSPRLAISPNSSELLPTTNRA